MKLLVAQILCASLDVCFKLLWLLACLNMCASVCAEVHDNDQPRQEGARQSKRGYTLDFVRPCICIFGVCSERRASLRIQRVCLAAIEIGYYLMSLSCVV